MLEVLPAWRRRGLGELLLRAAVNRALERGALPSPR
ncbi:MAG: GNAT family N-acetyltransferase [Intestinimonas sp.]